MFWIWEKFFHEKYFWISEWVYITKNVCFEIFHSSLSQVLINNFFYSCLGFQFNKRELAVV